MLYRVKIKNQHGTVKDAIFTNKKKAEQFENAHIDAHNYSLWYEYTAEDGVYTLDDLDKDD